MNPLMLAHADDPDVSKTAAVRVSGGSKAEQVMRAVVHILIDRGPMTPDQLEAEYIRAFALNNWPELTSRSFVQKRVSEMKRHVLFVRDGIGRGILRSAGAPVHGAQPVDLNCDYVTALEAITDYKRKVTA